MSSPRHRVTDLLVTGPNAGATADELLSAVYEELRGLAAARLRAERPDHTLQATELVHEAYLKLVDQSRVAWQGQGHFKAVAAIAMRRILIDHARSRGRAKRGGGEAAVTLHENLRGAGEVNWDDVLAVDAAIEALRADSERQGRIVEMRLFAGLTMAEIATELGVSKRTVEGEWAHARAWLRRRLSDGP